MPQVIAAVGLGISAYGTYTSIQAGKKAAKAQSRALDLQNQAQEKQARFRDLQRKRQRQATVREYIRKRAAVVSTSFAQGASLGSAIAGGTGGLRSGATGQLTFLDQAQQLSSDISTLGAQASIFSGKAYSYQGDAQLGQAISSVGQLAFKYNYEIDSFGNKVTKSIFDQQVVNK